MGTQQRRWRVEASTLGLSFRRAATPMLLNSHRAVQNVMDTRTAKDRGFPGLVLQIGGLNGRGRG